MVKNKYMKIGAFKDISPPGPDGQSILSDYIKEQTTLPKIIQPFSVLFNPIFQKYSTDTRPAASASPVRIIFVVKICGFKILFIL
jgi:hypothetical protein